MKLSMVLQNAGMNLSVEDGDLVNQHPGGDSFNRGRVCQYFCQFKSEGDRSPGTTRSENVAIFNNILVNILVEV